MTSKSLQATRNGEYVHIFTTDVGNLMGPGLPGEVLESLQKSAGFLMENHQASGVTSP